MVSDVFPGLWRSGSPWIWRHYSSRRELQQRRQNKQKRIDNDIVGNSETQPRRGYKRIGVKCWRTISAKLPKISMYSWTKILWNFHLVSVFQGIYNFPIYRLNIKLCQTFIRIRLLSHYLFGLCKFPYYWVIKYFNFYNCVVKKAINCS